MVYIRSLLWLFFLLNALKHYWLVHQVDKNRLEFDKDVIETSDSGKEIVDGMKAGIRGRKMMVEEVKGEKETEKIGISGKEENSEIEKSLQGQHWKHYQGINFALFTSPKDYVKFLNFGDRHLGLTIIQESSRIQPKIYNVEHMKKLKVETENSTILENPRKNTNYNNGELEANKVEEENQKLLDATKQMINLMKKDYPHATNTKRKPPINNSLPFP